MDWGSLAGLVLALAAIAGGQWVEGGKLAALVQPAAMVIVAPLDNVTVTGEPAGLSRLAV